MTDNDEPTQEQLDAVREYMVQVGQLSDWLVQQFEDESDTVSAITTRVFDEHFMGLNAVAVMGVGMQIMLNACKSLSDANEDVKFLHLVAAAATVMTDTASTDKTRPGGKIQ